MEIKLDQEHGSTSEKDQEQTKPLLNTNSGSDEIRKTLVQKAISQTFQSTAHLANLLPTGTVLAFQLLAPIFANQGQCDPVSRFMTATLVALCAASSFFLSFTDSFKAPAAGSGSGGAGTIYYGVATLHGLWVIDGSVTLAPEEAAKYRLRVIDFVHAVMSVLVFCAVALFDESVVGCFYPTPSEETREVLTALPVGIGVFCSMLFVVFPTKRHGIGFPISQPAE